MAGPLDGVRVVEVASWMFVPSAGAVLVDQGAEVLKIEHPETGDPQRGLVTSGLLPGGAEGVNFMMEQPNHGKKSVAIDLSHPDGREALLVRVQLRDICHRCLLSARSATDTCRVPRQADTISRSVLAMGE